MVEKEQNSNQQELKKFDNSSFDLSLLPAQAQQILNNQEKMKNRLDGIKEILTDEKDVSFHEICEQLRALREKDSDKKKIAVIQDVMKTIDNYQKIAVAAKTEHETSIYDSFVMDLSDILYRAGVDSFQKITPDGKLDSKTQKITQIEYTEKPELEGTVADSINCGYVLDNEKLLRKESVKIFKYKKPIIRK